MHPLRKLHIRYHGSDSAIIISFKTVSELGDELNNDELDDVSTIITRFEQAHHQRYGFNYENRELVVEAVSVEVIGLSDRPEEPIITAQRSASLQPISTIKMYTADRWQETPFSIAPLFYQAIVSPAQH